MAAAPNLAYAYGTTPPSGGVAAIVQAITSMLLGVSTSIAAAISATGSQAVTPAAMTNIGVGTPLWINWGLADQECVSVTTVTGTTFTATFTKTHGAGATVTCGLPTLGVASPWTALGALGLTGIANVFVSSAATAVGDKDYIPVLLGYGYSGSNGLSFGTAEDVDAAGHGAQPRSATNYNGSYLSSYMTLQDASFSYWICVCEFGIVVETLVGSTYQGAAAGSFRTPQPLSQRGVGVSTAALPSGSNSVTVTPDISARVTPGQKVLIVNNSHNSTTAGWPSAPELLTVQSVSGTGSQATIVFSTTTGQNFDAGALVGSVPQKYAYVGGSPGLDQNQVYMCRNLDGTYAGSQSQTGTPDYSVITANMGSYEGPTSDPNVLYAGELDLPVYQSGSYKGCCGYVYCLQEFATASSVSNGDVYADPSVAAVWKAFKGGNIFAMGPLLNPLNTTASMNPVASTPWIP